MYENILPLCHQKLLGEIPATCGFEPCDLILVISPYLRLHWLAVSVAYL